MKLLKCALLVVVMLSVLLLFILFVLCDVHTDSQLVVFNSLSYNTSHIIHQDEPKEHQYVYNASILKNFTKDVSVDTLSNHMDKQETPIVAVPAVVAKFPLVAKRSVIAKQSEPYTGAPHTLHRYTICSSYWEQQSNGILNLFSLQRWAHSVGMTVVEPFAYQSELTFPEQMLHNNTLANTLRLRDYLDIDYWNAETNETGVPPLETWENFVVHSTKQIILVILPYSGPGGTYTNDEIKNHSQCHETMSDFFHEHGKLFQSLQFEVVRNVCFSFNHYVIPAETFNSGLQIEDIKKNATVWITEWQGVDNGRVAFTGLNYNRFGRILGGESKYLAMIKPSRRLVNDSYRYVHEVLGVEFYQYDALVIRHKMIAKRGKEWNVRRFNECASQLENHVRSITNKMFLATDLGKFGDKINPHRLDLDSQRRYTGHGIYLFKRYLNMVYGNKSIDNYENDFVRVSNGITDSGYIAALQRTIALHAKHVFLVGGHSSFQVIIKDHFANQHDSNAVTKLCFKF